MTDEILPCPACGRGSAFENHVGRRVRLYCAFDDCGVCGPFKDIIRDAIVAWNALSRNEWQPISTAPKGKRLCDDGQFRRQKVIVWAGGCCLAYCDENGQWRGIQGRAMNTQPTCWMPLPAPPKEGDN